MSFMNGFCGQAIVNGEKIACTDAAFMWKQPLLFYDHTFGLLDAGGKGISRYFVRPGTRIIEGTINFPLAGAGSGLFDHVKSAGPVDVSIEYNTEKSGEFAGCRLDNYSLSVSAGGLVEIAAGFIGDGHGYGSGGRGGRGIGAEEAPSPRSSVSSGCWPGPNLVSWSEVEIDVGSSGAGGDIQGFDLQVSNNCNPIYVEPGGPGDILDPREIRVGVQVVSGSISFYGVNIGKYWADEETTRVGFSAGGLDIQIIAMFEPVNNMGIPGAVVSTMPFVGVGTNFY